MKKWWIALTAALTLGVMGSVQAVEFEEGVHYEVISDERTEQREVIDFFSFYCNACFQFQPFSRMLAEEFGDDFKKYPVAFLGPNGMGETTVQAWAAAKVLDVQDEVGPAIFREHFTRRNLSTSLNELQTIFASVGVEADDFERAYNSFPARSLTNRMRRDAENYQIRATPTYIINGRYRMMQEGFRNSSNFFQDYLELARYLAARED